VKQGRGAPGPWLVLLGCFVAQMGLGCGYVFSATLKHVVADFDWSRAAYAAGGIPLLLAMGLSAPWAGALSERFGARAVVASASLLLGGSLVLLSRMESLVEFYLASALLGLGMTGVGDVVVGALASRWVRGGRGLVLGVIFVGSNVGGAAVPSLADAVAATASWRVAFLVIAVAAVALILPTSLALLREPPVGASDGAGSPSDEPEPSLDLSEAVRTRSFWILAAALLAFYFYYLGVNQHLVAFVSDLGYSDARAAASLGFAVLLGGFAKLAMGLAADRVSTKAALIANFALLGVGSLLVLAAASPPLLLGFLVIHGFAVAAENVVLPLVVAECFGVRHLARIYGALMITLFPGGALGPIFAGAVFDRLGSYQLAFGTFALLNLLALLALFGLRRESGRPALASAVAPGTGG
jgi:MFS family permease